jgi:hypothetical protein
MRGTALAAGAVAALLGTAALAGCSGLKHASDNKGSVQPTGPASIIQFPYGFRNVAYKCDGPNMVYSGSAGVDDSLPPSIAVVPNDPRCPGHVTGPGGQ